MVASGELVPVNGTLAAAPAVLDESALTGEPRPVERSPGEPVRSGVLNAGAPFDLRATATARDSTYAGIVRLVAEAEQSQAPFVRLADRYALWFLGLSLAAGGAAWALAGADRAVAVLVVATPCPLILAPPSRWCRGCRSPPAAAWSSRRRRAERLAQCTTLLLDKTGTLTSGRPALAEVIPAGPLPAGGAAPGRVPGPGVPARPGQRRGARGRGRNCELVLPGRCTRSLGRASGG